jgi:L-amino acid N-acyltransferase YncA
MEQEMDLKIDAMRPDDWEQVKAIYWEGILTGNATFEAQVAEWEKWDSSHVVAPLFVIWNGSQIAGWAALSRVSARQVYAGVAEVSIYMGDKYRGQGLGSSLFSSFIRASEEKGFWTLQAGIFPENVISIEFHRKHGFRILGVREKVGKMTFGELKGKWRNACGRPALSHGLAGTEKYSGETEPCRCELPAYGVPHDRDSPI